MTYDGWHLLYKCIGYIHIKDAKLEGGVKAAGEGDRQVVKLLTRLNVAS